MGVLDAAQPHPKMPRRVGCGCRADGAERPVLGPHDHLHNKHDRAKQGRSVSLAADFHEPIGDLGPRVGRVDRSHRAMPERNAAGQATKIFWRCQSRNLRPGTGRRREAPECPAAEAGEQAGVKGHIVGRTCRQAVARIKALGRRALLRRLDMPGQHILLAPNAAGCNPQNTHRLPQFASTCCANTCWPTRAAASRIRSVSRGDQAPWPASRSSCSRKLSSSTDRSNSS